GPITTWTQKGRSRKRSLQSAPGGSGGGKVINGIAVEESLEMASPPVEVIVTDAIQNCSCSVCNLPIGNVEKCFRVITYSNKRIPGTSSYETVRKSHYMHIQCCPR